MITTPIPTPKADCLDRVAFAVISDWDEATQGFEEQRLLRNPKQGNLAMATMLKEQILVRSQAVVARVVAGETLIVPIRDKVGDLASIYSLNGTVR